ncbi:MAG TPA: cytochrome c oxidase subunit 3 [Polyangiaceae bacterium]|jgi:cytochrome c oxidase subunit 3|nr:cytochrome c oxidase subunit 3 [Polyangiaceae bacterium]
MAEQVAEQFEDLPRQAHAARLGMWIFLGTEVLFFSGLFALYAAYRAEHPYGFGVGVEENTVVWGSVNTGILLVSSYTVALAVHELRRGERRACALLLGVTIALGLGFLAVKTGEYMKHFHEGLYPGGVGTFYATHGDAGTKMFFTLYFCMTGLHAVHVFVGTGVLSFLLVQVLRRRIGPAAPHPLAIGAIYWHLVDVIWIFLWPLFYLIPGSRP